MKPMLTAALAVLVLSAATARAQSTSAGSITWDGKIIAYKITTNNTASTSVSSSNDKCTMDMTLDGASHKLAVTKEGLEYGKKKVAVKDYKKLDVIFENGKLRVLADGKQVLPAPEKKKEADEEP